MPFLSEAQAKEFGGFRVEALGFWGLGDLGFWGFGVYGLRGFLRVCLLRVSSEGLGFCPGVELQGVTRTAPPLPFQL